MQQESKFEYLSGLRDDGTLKNLIDIGVLSWKVFFFLDVYSEYDILIKKGFTKMDAVHKTAIKFNVDITTIYRALKRLDYENCSADPNDTRKK